MSGEPLITIVGNAAGDAELRFLPTGVGVVAFTVAVTPRVKKGDSWVDGDTSWFRCTAWREMAEQCAESITKGMRLIVHGRLKTRQYEKDGQTRTSVEIDVEEVGPSLRYAVASVKRMQRSGGDSRQAQAPGGGGFDDPWATSGASSGPVADSSEPPF